MTARRKAYGREWGGDASTPSRGLREAGHG